MLKWAINQPRHSYLSGEEERLGVDEEEVATTTMATTTTTTTSMDYKEFHALRRKLKRKSLTTSTPLPAASLPPSLRRTLIKDSMSPLEVNTPTPLRPSNKCVYASTLPTFEAEYSPSQATATGTGTGTGTTRTTCGITVPGPLLALRGLCVPDSYFDKPRYLDEQQQQQKEQEQEPPGQLLPEANTTNALSSRQMGDVTLERMIDAILESTRKPPNHRYASTHSSTYRPAFDPASDLCENWPTAHFEEREIIGPPSHLPTHSRSKIRSQQLLLRRQRVVRRKRKIATKISSSVRHSAQKLLSAASRSSQKEMQKQNVRRHISPDSGHNSELEDLEAPCHLEALFARDVTKRRLSFS
ncbi:uncharacterized protein Dwil_GK17157 [Drosophila willistoni]|uniref:Uncharacterized protein n=1 Tax=Drosophila willistoni TaxID=7260 RepID=B4NQ38_DROWI|nr:uncharacterized protein LOC6652964 [Drosophila willistoni]EDW86263.1 uncharacterized protein Dwil_GK17157 [Drosophila willistoni]